MHAILWAPARTVVVVTPRSKTIEIKRIFKCKKRKREEKCSISLKTLVLLVYTRQRQAKKKINQKDGISSGIPRYREDSQDQVHQWQSVVSSVVVQWEGTSCYCLRLRLALQTTRNQPKGKAKLPAEKSSSCWWKFIKDFSLKKQLDCLGQGRKFMEFYEKERIEKKKV